MHVIRNYYLIISFPPTLTQVLTNIYLLVIGLGFLLLGI